MFIIQGTHTYCEKKKKIQQIFMTSTYSFPQIGTKHIDMFSKSIVTK